MKTPATPPLETLPRDDKGPVFKAPWEAQAFAMAVALHERGVFTWPEWAEALAGRIGRAQAAGDADRGDSYYVHWLGALEDLLARKSVASADELHRYQEAWSHAAERTPHGQPVELQAQDLAAAAPK